jgi:STE24 endopeptidase
MTPFHFSLLFLAFTAASVGLGVWLALRQRAHVHAHRENVPADFVDAITLHAHRRAADYTVAKLDAELVESGADALLLLALTLGGGLAALHAWAASQFAHPYAVALALFGAYALVTGLVGVPFRLYRTFVVEARFGFNRTTLATWLLDAAKGVALTVAFGTPLLLAVLWLMERMGALWWLYVWLAWLAFGLLMLSIYPNFIAPLFNRFQPLTDTALKERIDALLARSGFAARDLFVMDGSRRSSHGNAFFTGFGKSKRIVFFDTLLERLAPREIEAVLAHELGHFKRRHILQRLVLHYGLSLLVLALLGWLIDKPWFYEGLGWPLHGHAPQVAVSLLLFLVVLPVFTFWFAPVASLISRRHEFEADAYAAQQTDARDLISALVKLYRDNAATLTPDPLHSAVYDSHPPAAMRVAHLKTLALQSSAP